jgi:1-acyl-sn-glycerol-3-phosphate acyltransferase
MTAPLEDLTFDVFGRDPAFIARVAPWLDRLLDRWFEVEVEGLEHIPASGRAILVANHGGALPYDALVLIGLLQRRGGRALRPLLEDAVMTAPFLGTWMQRLGAVRASQDNAQRLLDREEIVAVFPEGLLGLSKLYTHRYKLTRFGRGGFVRLAHSARAPLIPVSILGAEDAAPLLTKINFLFRGTDVDYLPVTPFAPLPARWSIRFGEPIDVRAELGEAPDAVSTSGLASSIRDRIQDELDTLADARGPAWHRPF